MLKEEFFIFFLLWINEKKIKKNKCGEDESKFISIIDNVYPVFRFVFFLLLLSFFLLLMNFFNSIISAESRYGHLLIYTNIFSVFFVIRCHAAPYIFFCILFYLILKLWNFSFFLSLQCPAMVFAQIGGAVPNAGAFSFIFPQKSRSHWIIQHIYRIQETMNTVIRRMSYKSRDVDRILLLKKYYFTVNWNNFFLQTISQNELKKTII